MDRQTFPSLSQLKRLVDEFAMLLSESADFHLAAEPKQALQTVLASVLQIRRRLEQTSEHFVLAIVGQSNVGKSTLLAALLGTEIAPRRNGPCTAVPIEFTWGSKYQIHAEFQGRLLKPVWDCASTSEVRDILGSLADESNSDISERPQRVTVRLPLPLLKSGLIIADTPGFGAAQLGQDLEGTHEAALKHYLLHDVCQVLWVVLGDQGIGKREQAFHDEFLAAICDDIVVTGCDDWDENDKQRFRRRFSSNRGLQKPQFHFVSGLQALRAKENEDATHLDATGILDLEQRVRELADESGRLHKLATQLDGLVRSLGDWLAEYRDERRRRLSTWWRPDSWTRWKCLPSHAFKARLDLVLEQRSP